MPLHSLVSTELDFAKKKTRRNFFIDSTGKLIFHSFFFSPYSDPPARRRPGFFLHYLSTAAASCPDTAIFFHTGQSAVGLAGGGARVKSARAERAPVATRPITYQNKTGFFTREFIFILFHFILSFFFFLLFNAPSPRAFF